MTAKRTATKAAPKRTRKPPAGPKANGQKGRQPVTPDAEIAKWIKAEAARRTKAGEKVTTAGLLRAWRAQGGKANPKRFAGLVAQATS
jgi:hypothetical protein